MTTSAVQTRGLTKHYRGGAEALRGVDLDVPPGQVFGLLGPNGAGKTTLVKVLLTVVRSTAGSARLLGKPLGDRGVLARVGFLPEAHRFPEYLTGRSVLRLYAAMAGVARTDRNRRADRLLDEVDLADVAARKVGHYSRGMRQRLALAQALMNEPRLVFLDEPTSGLDPVGRVAVRRIIERLGRDGVTVFLNSHLLGEVEMTCDAIAILVEGRIRRVGSIPELTGGRENYRIRCQGGLGGLAQQITRAGGVVQDQSVRLEGGDIEAINAVIDLLRAAGVRIVAVQPERASLEDVFLSAVQRSAPPARPVAPPGASP